MSAMTRWMYVGSGIALLVCMAVAAPAGGQEGAPPPTAAIPVQGLTFETFVPGVSSRIGVRDGSRRAEWRLEGVGEVEVVLTLPESLSGPGDRRIPLEFRYGDVAVSLGGELRLVDPRQPFTLRLRPEGVRLLVGGTARPGLEDLAGEYGADIQVLLVER